MAHFEVTICEDDISVGMYTFTQTLDFIVHGMLSLYLTQKA